MGENYTEAKHYIWLVGEENFEKVGSPEDENIEDVKALKEEITQLRIERDFYKTEYELMIDKLLRYSHIIDRLNKRISELIQSLGVTGGSKNA